ncbi:MAG: DUF4177 domain-containing protein [Actinomycetia bacterium]|nr:DUF4177 domain-containing protein [Actinomycetes bacterium]
MPYYIDRTTLSVIVTAPGGAVPANSDVIDGVTAVACNEQLKHGDILTPTQRETLLAGDIDGFLATDPETAERALVAQRVRTSPALPAPGRWEYRVIPLTELGGLATAKGTAARMEESLNQLAAEGWELVTTSERDARFMGGETVILTVRRFVVTEHMFAERFRAEERLRQQIARELADES